MAGTIPTAIESLSTTAASNDPTEGSGAALTLVNDGLRAAYAFVRQTVTAGSDIASASTITPPSTGSSFNLTGTTTVTAIGSTNSWDGRIVWFRHTGAHSFTNSATLVCIGGQSVTFASGDISAWRQRTSGTWDQVAFLRGGYDANIPRSTTATTAAIADRGKCIAISAGITIPASTFFAGDAISLYNDSASSVTITQGSGLTLRFAGTTSTGNRTLAARGYATVWFNSATEAVIMGSGVS